jgi:hypothetical protein
MFVEGIIRVLAYILTAPKKLGVRGREGALVVEVDHSLLFPFLFTV